MELPFLSGLHKAKPCVWKEAIKVPRSDTNIVEQKCCRLFSRKKHSHTWMHIHMHKKKSAVQAHVSWCNLWVSSWAQTSEGSSSCCMALGALLNPPSEHWALIYTQTDITHKQGTTSCLYEQWTPTETSCTINAAKGKVNTRVSGLAALLQLCYSYTAQRKYHSKIFPKT